MRPISRITMFSSPDSWTILRIISAGWCNKGAALDALSAEPFLRCFNVDFSAGVGVAPSSRSGDAARVLRISSECAQYRSGGLAMADTAHLWAVEYDEISRASAVRDE